MGSFGGDEDVLVLTLRATEMKNVDGLFGASDPAFGLFRGVDNLFDKSDPFFEVGDDEQNCIAQSKVIHNNLNPQWTEVIVDMRDLCEGNRDKTIFLTFYDFEDDGRHQFMGEFKTTVNELLTGAKKYKDSKKSTKKENAFCVLYVDNVEFGNVFVVDAKVQKGTQVQASFIPTVVVTVAVDGRRVEYDPRSSRSLRSEPDPDRIADAINDQIQKAVEGETEDEASQPEKAPEPLVPLLRNGPGAEPSRPTKKNSYVHFQEGNTVMGESSTKPPVRKLSNYDRRSFRDIQAKKAVQGGNRFIFTLLVTNLGNSDGESTAGGLDPFFELTDSYENRLLVSEVLRGNQWSTVDVSFEQISGGNLNRTFSLKFFDRRDDGEHELLGDMQTSVNKMIKAAKHFNVMEQDTDEIFAVHQFEMNGVKQGNVFVLNAEVISEADLSKRASNAKAKPQETDVPVRPVPDTHLVVPKTPAQARKQETNVLVIPNNLVVVPMTPAQARKQESPIRPVQNTRELAPENVDGTEKPSMQRKMSEGLQQRVPVVSPLRERLAPISNGGVGTQLLGGGNAPKMLVNLDNGVSPKLAESRAGRAQEEPPVVVAAAGMSRPPPVKEGRQEPFASPPIIVVEEEEEQTAVGPRVQTVEKDDGKDEEFTDEWGEPGELPALPGSAFDDVPKKPKIDFLRDPKFKMTWSRRIALSMRHVHWYNPRGVEWRQQVADEAAAGGGLEEGDLRISLFGAKEHRTVETRPSPVTHDEHPLLAKGWAFFEHVTLTRYIEKDGGKRNMLARAEPGDDENPTRLYHPLCTPASQMGDFGLGVGLYFSMLRGLFLLLVLAAAINVPNMMYYASSSYSDGQVGVDILLKGSAICTRTSWVPCPNCTATKFEPSRIATASVTVDNATKTLTFALRNQCDFVTLALGWTHYGSMLLVAIGMFLIAIFEDRETVKFDEDEQTAQDYSIFIDNPPPDAFDPAEWREFFHREFNGAHATVVTIVLDNDLLLQTLLRRRELLRKISLRLEPGTSMDILTLARIGAEIRQQQGFLRRLVGLVFPGIPEMFHQVASLETEIMGLAQLNYKVIRVYASFEYEEHQRAVLSGLTVSPWDSRRQNKKDWTVLFRGIRVLNVKEPVEPNDINWMNTNVKILDLVKATITSTSCAGVAIVLIAFLIERLHGASPPVAAAAISITNVSFPVIAKFLTSFERHASESSRQTSLYFKIAIFRWVNTAIVISFITPFTRTITNKGGLLESIYAIFFADIVTSNVLQLLDLPGHFQRHYLAPRAPSQDMMYLQMKGQDFELAERYTNVTKILFLTLWYSSLYPAAFIFCAFFVFVSYFADRFSIMRTWARQPLVGTSIATFSRQYFFTTCLVAMAVISAYNWSGFPYDNICDAKTSVSSDYIGSHNATTLDNIDISVDVVKDDPFYKYCFQDLRNQRAFPPNPRFQPQATEWMTETQERVVSIYGWTSLVILSVVAWAIFYSIFKTGESFFRAQYMPTGEDQNIPFSSVQAISSYIPQVTSRFFNYPLLATSTKGLDPDLYDWQDPYRTHSYYDLTEDALDVINHLEGVKDKRVFSIVSHEKPPPRRERLAA